MPTITILGTGTGIGKTFVSCALARALAKLLPNTPILGLKPIESGTSAIPGPNSDAALLAAASHPSIEPIPQPYAFHAALSPHLAARNVGAQVDLHTVLSWVDSAPKLATPAMHCHALPCPALSSEAMPCIAMRCTANTTHAHLSGPPPASPDQLNDPPIDRIILLESAGGVFSPLSPTLTNFDLARAVPNSLWLLVAPDRLGVLHDLTTTLFMMSHRGKVPDLIVLSQPDPTDPSLNTNAAELATLGIATVCATISHQGEVPHQLLEALLQALVHLAPNPPHET